MRGVASRLLPLLLWVHGCPRTVGLKNESLRFCWVDASLRLYALCKLDDFFGGQLPVGSHANDNGDNDGEYDNNAQDNGCGTHPMQPSTK
jgi:hypothetical protein